jgi:hypothetical protein
MNINIHSILDILSTDIRAFLGLRKKLFSESSKSLAPSVLLKSASIALPSINKEGTYRVKIKLQTGTVYADFRVEKWLGEGFPTIIYHHGHNEKPFDYGNSAKSSFYHVFVKHKQAFNSNLFVFRAAFHEFDKRTHQKKLRKLENFVSMFVASTRLIEALIQEIRKKNHNQIIVSGMSLGGFVCNYHRTKYNTADVYIPMLAGTLLGDLFTTSRYRKFVALDDKQTCERVRNLLNFTNEFTAVADKNIYPVLALYDQYVMYKVEKNSYQGYPIEKLKAGHLTGVIQFNRLRSHILKIQNETT